MRRLLTTIVLATVLAAGCGGGGGSGGSGADVVAKGEDLYQGEGTCATCHGDDLKGTPMGPPFLDAIYAPSHHPDAAFVNAVQRGVQPHHWQFGPMPPLPHLSEADIEAITAYVRSVQEANGIR